MHLAHEAQRERECAQALQPVHHRVDVVRHLADVVEWSSGLRFALKTQQVRKRRLRALDLRRQDRLFACVHVEEEVLTGQQQRDAVQPPEGALGRRQRAEQADQVETGRGGRQRVGDERPHLFTRDGRGDESTRRSGRHA